MNGMNFFKKDVAAKDVAAKDVATRDVAEKVVLLGLLAKREALEVAIADVQEKEEYVAMAAALKRLKEELRENEAAVAAVVRENGHLLGKSGKAELGSYRVWRHVSVKAAVSEEATTDDLNGLLVNFPGLCRVTVGHTEAKRLASRRETRELMERLGVVLEKEEQVKLKRL